MRPANDIDAFRAAPDGTFVTGESWLYYCVDARFFGQIYWGCPAAPDIQRLTQIWDVEQRSEGHVSLVDARQLLAVAQDAFALLARNVSDGQVALRGRLQRQAIVRPQGLVGALATGFYGMLQPAYEVQVFDHVEGALAWLGRPELAPVVLLLGEHPLGEGAMVRALRQHLGGSLRATLPSAARGLGVSERTLQRRLREAGTTFQQEMQKARVREAERLLLDPERKLTAIAAEVGCGSLQHFSSLFRRLTGLSPTEWRARRK
jgi:AraC-like DNA-binding protein